MKAILFPVVLLGCIAVTRAQTPPASGEYLIVSGRFESCCGIVGPLSYPLPTQGQTYVRLDVNLQQQTASFAFLHQDETTVFQVPACPPLTPVPFSFTNGVVFPDRIVFRSGPGPGPSTASWDYTLTNALEGLHIQGTLMVPIGLCADFPNQFRHTNVVAARLPAVTIRTSEVEVCWNSISNRNHQVQYRPSLGTNGWTNLGEPLAGNGSTLCITDPVPAGEPRRFYRVLTLP